MGASDDVNGHFSAAFDQPELTPEMIRNHEKTVRAEFWDKLKRVARRVPFVDDLVAAYYCAMDPDTPVRVRGMLLGALAYFILPTDVIPDMIAGLGYTDDAAVLATAIGLVSSHMKPKHRAAAARALDKDIPDDLAAD